MPVSYSPEAVEKCRALYLKYGGKNHAAIEAEMQREYPGWQKGNLEDKGIKRPRMGWVTKYGFERSLEIHTAKLVMAVNNDEQDLYIGIRTVRKALEVEAIGRNANKDSRREYREYCKLEIEARRNLELGRDNFETFVAGYEKLVMWLGDVDPAAANLLIRNGKRLAELAEALYGKAETDDDGTSSRTDEIGQ